MDADVWLFIKWICGHGADDIARFHRPLAYFLAGDAVRLAAALNTYESEIVSQIKADLDRRKIDWNTRQGIERLARLLRRVNNRISRSMGKTTIGLDVILWLASKNPDISIGIASKSDPAAWQMCQTIGNIMRTPAYAMYYQDRLFRRVGSGGYDLDSFITNKWIRMNGRTVPAQETIEARGVNSQWYSKHYHVIYCDDLSSTEAKQGEATVDDAIRFIASFHGISISDRWGGTRYVLVGTIQGPKDDHAAISNNPDYISVVIPIWKKKIPANLSNLLEDGVPVLPELYDLDACKQKRADTLANDHLGAISWLQNFEMTAHEAGAMQFSAELLKRAKFVWITKARMVGSTKQQYRVIRRYLWEADEKGNRVPLIDQTKKEEPCLCWMACGDTQHAYVERDPLQLHRYLGVDQSLALRGDKWSVGVAAGADVDGVMYALKGKSDRGYRTMINAIPYVYQQWGGAENPPRKVGIESNAWQQITADWLKHDEAFRFLARRVEPVSPGMTQKELRIFNNVLANLEMGLLCLDPDDHERDAEMLKYNAAADDPEDNILDSIAIAVTVATSRQDNYSDEERARDERRAESEYASSIDPSTNIDLTNDFLEGMWN